MIKSMTAFSRQEEQGDWGSLVCEMRSINHRYLEINLNLPDALRQLEMPIREGLKKNLRRGKVECTLRYKMNHDAEKQISINTTLVEAIANACDTIENHLSSSAPMRAVEVLRFPGVMESKEIDMAQLQPLTLSLVDQTSQDLVAARKREGDALSELFATRLEAMETELAKVRQQLPKVLQEARERLVKRFEEAKVDLEPTRLEQELVLFAQKMDVAEEIDRATTHINEFRRILKEGGTVGRRLDFLLQELNREANTLGSKSGDPIVTHAAVELKVVIEQIREQVQNVE